MSASVINDPGPQAGTVAVSLAFAPHSSLSVGGSTVQAAIVGQPIVFTPTVTITQSSSSLSPPLTVVDYLWDFGDGTAQAGLSGGTMTHTYLWPAFSTVVTLRVTDSLGRYWYASQPLYLSVPASTLGFNGSLSAVPHGTFTQFAWHPANVNEMDRYPLAALAWSYHYAWNVALSNTSSTTVVANTWYLVFRDFGFSIPAGATITGITVALQRNLDPYSGTTGADTQVQLMKGGVMQATNRSTGTAWGGVTSAATYGGATDLWSSTWTPADINAPNFGFAFAGTIAVPPGQTGTGYAGTPSITVAYTI